MPVAGNGAQYMLLVYHVENADADNPEVIGILAHFPPRADPVRDATPLASPLPFSSTRRS
jgi:hypothetical protein